MEKVVPWVPFLSDVNTFATSKRVANFDFDQLTNLPALDRIELRKRR
jgi:hypothetical protein